MRRFLLLSLAAAAAVVFATSAFGGATPGLHPVMYNDGAIYGTIDTPAFFNATASAAAPEGSWNTLYVFPSATGLYQLHLSSSAPGDTDYRGGRWIVYAVTFTGGYAAAAATYGGTNHIFDYESEVLAAIDAGVATTTFWFTLECPVLPLSENHR